MWMLYMMLHAVPWSTVLCGATMSLPEVWFGTSFKESILLKTVVIYLVLSVSKYF